MHQVNMCALNKPTPTNPAFKLRINPNLILGVSKIAHITGTLRCKTILMEANNTVTLILTLGLSHIHSGIFNINIKPMHPCCISASVSIFLNKVGWVGLMLNHEGCTTPTLHSLV